MQADPNVATSSLDTRTYTYTHQVLFHVVFPFPLYDCVGNRLLIRLGDKEVEFNPDFKFYITTKLSNPHYTPEISTKTAIVNFAVKEQGHSSFSMCDMCDMCEVCDV